MNHTKLIVGKFLISFAILFVILGLGYGLAIQSILFINLVSIISYFVGDLMILPRTNNIIAATIDAAIAFAVIYLLGDLLTVGGDPLTASFLSAIGIGIFEFIYHKYVAEHFTEPKNQVNSMPDKFNQLDLMTESAYEISPDLNKLKREASKENKDE